MGRNRQHLASGRRGLATPSRHPYDQRRNRFDDWLDGPRTILRPTLMQLFPDYWDDKFDSPCYLLVGNWLDATTDDVVSGYNIRLVLRASGVNPKKGAKPPAGTYGVNHRTGCQPTVVECPINHRETVCSLWLDMCKQCIAVWKGARPNETPPAVFVHCNEGINRAPAWACILASKLHGCQPMDAARVLANARDINPMYRHGKVAAEGHSMHTFDCMLAVENVEPQRIPFREGMHCDVSTNWKYVAPHDRDLKWEPPARRVTLVPNRNVLRPVANLGVRPSSSQDVRVTSNVPVAHPRAKPSPYQDVRLTSNVPVVNPRAKPPIYQDVRLTPNVQAALAAGSQRYMAELRHGGSNARRERRIEEPVPRVTTSAAPEYDNDFDDVIGPELQQYLDKHTNGHFAFNADGRHVLHQLAEDFRSELVCYDGKLWEQAMWATHNRCRDGLDVRTTGSRPHNATVLSAVCKQAWKAWGCQPDFQFHAVAHLLSWGCNPNLRCGNMANTVLMEIAGAGHVDMFRYWYERIVWQHWSQCNLQSLNANGRNLWSIAGLAHDTNQQPKSLRRQAHPEIKAMVWNLAEFGFMKSKGLATQSTAHRGKRRRVEDKRVVKRRPAEVKREDKRLSIEVKPDVKRPRIQDHPEDHPGQPSSSSRRPSCAASVCLSSSSSADDFQTPPASSDYFCSCSNDSESDNVGLSGPLERSRSESPT